MKRLALWAGAIAALVVLVALAVVVLLPYLVDLPRVRSLIAGSASQALGRPVRFASVAVRLLPLPAVELRGLEVAEDPRFGKTPFVTLERGLLRLRLTPLLLGRVEFGGLLLERPLIRMVEAADGRLNVSSLGVVHDAASALRSPGPTREARGSGSATTFSLLAAGVMVEDAQVIYVPSHPGAGEYRLSGLDVRLRGSGPALAVEGKGVLAPGDVVVQVTEGSLALGGVRSLSEAPLAGKVVVETSELRPLGALLQISGLRVSGAGRGIFNLGGVLGSPQASGQVMLPRLALSRTTRLCAPPERTISLEGVSVTASLDERQFFGRPVTARIVGGALRTNATVALDRTFLVTLADVSVRGLPLEPVLVDFLCDGYAVTGPLDLTGALAFHGADAMGSLSGDGRFSIGRGRVVGAQAMKLFGDLIKVGEAVAAALGEDVASPLEFESITGTYRVANGVATTRDLLYTGRGFSVTAAGEYAFVRDGLNVDMVVRHRRGQTKARITGTAAAPVLHVDVAGALREIEPRGLERDLRNLLKRFR
ncbi:MAG: AsmA family protein [Candidatus Rokuibacteriota bacterium]